MLTLAIQAGGASTRMGQDKALMDFGGVPLIEHLLTRLGSLAAETLITANYHAGYRYLGVRLVPDLIPGRGALGGLFTALHAASQPLVAVVACDMPFASRALLVACRDLLIAQPDYDAVIPSSEHGLEPLHAVYRRAACLPPIRAALDAGQWKAIAWHAQARIHILSPAETARHDPEGLAFANVNTPAELEWARQHLGGQSSR
jgi:molybdopterin-guanine dinucleotide biosynthesis protein A